MKLSERASHWDVPSSNVAQAVRPVEPTASKGPLVLIVDDLHAADDPSLALLQSLARMIAEAPIVVIMNFQEEAAKRPTSVGKQHPRIGRNGRTIKLRAVESRGVGRLISVPKTEPAPAENLLRRDGAYWTIAWEGKAFLLKDTYGLRYLSAPLAEPGREYHALDLVAGAKGPALSRDSAASEPGVAFRPDLGDAGPILDAEAKAQYRRRLVDLRAELEEAERFNDTGRATRNREEIEFLTEELARATGLGGRDRKAASAAERARANVTMAIRAALKRIAEQSPSLGRHLAATVRTGKFCSYTPDPRLEISWRS
ncbi:MAG: ATP-binding protein [Candidatus Binatia bacterium]